ncbi:MAG: phosphatidate cytidylyltransferase [Acidobacteria bacterium]|nr:phosphatidate cytidylyltransferase [Acidobacteriota bacterium]
MARIATALVLIPAVVWIVLLGPAWLLLAAAAFAGLRCYYEYSRLAARFGFGELGPLGYAGGLLLLTQWRETLAVLVLVALLALALSLRRPELHHALPRAALLLFGVVYVFGAWKAALALRALDPHWLMLPLVLTWSGDVAAYYAGRRFGRRPLAAGISPAKTWEGAIASLAAAIVVAALYSSRFLPALFPLEAAALATAANLAGQAGDLSESAIKRGAGVKDSGGLLPGHGGLLDRVDSTLFALPVVYLYTALRF